jgi:short subunit dehydrogenase-like uncharacterized protein
VSNLKQPSEWKRRKRRAKREAKSIIERNMKVNSRLSIWVSAQAVAVLGATMVGGSVIRFLNKSRLQPQTSYRQRRRRFIRRLIDLVSRPKSRPWGIELPVGWNARLTM